MQVALSIQAGKISSALLFASWATIAAKTVVLAAQEVLGAPYAPFFYWSGSPACRSANHVTGTTNKIESYNGFSKWLSFGGDVIGENDPDEQQKHLRYNDLVATAVIAQNTVDMAKTVADLKRDGLEDLSHRSGLPQSVPTDQHRETIRRLRGEL